MNYIHKRRNEVISINNTAQKELEDMVQMLDVDNITQLNVSKYLSGDINLKFIEEKCPNLVDIIFEKGDITSVFNIPKNTKKLVIPENLLIEVIELPSSMVHLDVRDNHIEKLELSHVKNLETIHCENNKLDHISLPTKIVSIYASNNNLKSLDLKANKILHILHIDNNPMLVLHNYDISQFTELNVENSPLVYIGSESPSIEIKSDKKETEQHIDYLTALSKFFKLKSTYDTSLKLYKHKIYGNKNQNKIDKPKCIKCNRKCGTIFSFKDRVYSAICGSKTDPCKLEIKLYRGEHIKNEDFMLSMKEIVDQDKEDIIIQKLDTLFGYTDEKQSVKDFKDKLEKYNEDNILYTQAIKKHKELYDNEEKKIQFKNKQQTMFKIEQSLQKMMEEYQMCKSNSSLRTIMNEYTKELMPIRRQLSNIKYAISEVEIEEINKTSTIKTNSLHQYEINPYDVFIHYGEQPQVQKFKI